MFESAHTRKRKKPLRVHEIDNCSVLMQLHLPPCVIVAFTLFSVCSNNKQLNSNKGSEILSKSNLSAELAHIISRYAWQ